MTTYTLIFSRFPVMPFKNKWTHHGYNLRGTVEISFGVYNPKLVSKHWALIRQQWDSETYIEEVLKGDRPLRKITITRY